MRAILLDAFLRGSNDNGKGWEKAKNESMVDHGQLRDEINYVDDWSYHRLISLAIDVEIIYSVGLSN